MKEEERIAEIVDERIDARIIELMDCPGCKLLLNRLSQQECVISRQKKSIDVQDERIVEQEREIKGLKIEKNLLVGVIERHKPSFPGDIRIVCKRCKGKGFVQYGSFGKRMICPYCHGEKA